MNQFNEIKEIFEKKIKFEDITRTLMNKEIIDKGKKILEKLDCKNYLNSRDLLSTFLINKYPRDVIGDKTIESNKNLIDFVNKILTKDYNDDNEFKMDIVKYSYYFKTWKNEDIEILKNQLFNEYHQLTIDMLNCEEDEEDKKCIYEETQKKILECASQIGGEEFVNKIQDYSPVVINTKDLQNEYDKAYNDVFLQEFKEKKYEKFSGLLEFSKNIFKTLRPKENIDIEKIMDIPYILHKLNFGKFTDTKKLELLNFMLDFIEKNQSEAQDDKLKEIRKELKVKNYCFPSIFLRVMNLIKDLIHDFEMIQQALQRK